MLLEVCQTIMECIVDPGELLEVALTHNRWYTVITLSSIDIHVLRVGVLPIIIIACTSCMVLPRVLCCGTCIYYNVGFINTPMLLIKSVSQCIHGGTSHFSQDLLLRTTLLYIHVGDFPL